MTLATPSQATSFNTASTTVKARDIASVPQQKTVFRFGILIAAVGVTLLVSIAAVAFRQLGDWEQLKADSTWLGMCAFGGILLVGVGFAGMTVGSTEIEGPETWDYSEQETPDARFESADQREVQTAHSSPEAAIVSSFPHDTICCIACRSLNDDESRFCDQCGTRFSAIAVA